MPYFSILDYCYFTVLCVMNSLYLFQQHDIFRLVENMNFDINLTL
ncbi:hypothetical protein AM422_002560 [Klebsiella pneumoniae]|nr:hypothetical protein AM422_002560 [Klebsiella pneumoniae]SSG63723.1 Uncharacterised protein [Klebsiella pneumoniae]VGO95976.1 hypothetical protein SB01124_01619 [Klebsiella quasipneumoniae subsp. quasipneumoniae]